MLKAVILIGGPQKGTRFRPLSLDLPKHLFPIAGRPMVQHLIEACVKVDTMSEIYLLGFYQLDQALNLFIQSMMSLYNVKIRYLQEYTTLGTCGGIYHFRDQITRSNPEAFFVINGDICGDFDLNGMLEFHRSKPKVMTIMVTEATRNQSLNYGCIVENDDSHQVEHYVEKPSTFISTTINCGVYVCSPKIFDHLSTVYREKQDEFSADMDDLFAGKEILSLEEDVLARLAGPDNGLYSFHTFGWWCQVKNAASAIFSNRYYLKAYRKSNPHFLACNGDNKPEIIGDVWIDPSAEVHPTAVIGPNVSISQGVKVGPGVRIKESIILKDASIHDHSIVLNSIIGWNTVLKCWVRVEGSPTNPNPDTAIAKMENHHLFNDEGKLNPSITVLGSNIHVFSGLMVLNSIVLPHKEITRSYRNEIIL